MSKRNKAAALALVILAMASALASCYWTGGEEKEAQGAKADGSTLSASFGGKAYDSFMELSDGTLDESADITFTATHTLGGSEVRGALFDFEIDAEGVELTEWGTKGRQCSLRLSDLKWLGTYRITAKSRLGREFDRTITVLLTSPVQKLEVSYALTSDGTGGKLTDEMKSGSITGVKQKLTLAAGGTYSLKATVSPLGSARTLLCSSTDTQSAYFTSVSGSEAELALPGADGAVFEIRISLGRTNVLVSADQLRHLRRRNRRLVRAGGAGKDALVRRQHRRGARPLVRIRPERGRLQLGQGGAVLHRRGGGAGRLGRAGGRQASVREGRQAPFGIARARAVACGFAAPQAEEER